MELEKLIEKFKNEQLEEPTEYTEPAENPFDAPIPGQSLTDEPGNYPWEHPPQFTDVDEVLDRLYNTLTKPTVARQLISMLDAGVPVEAIVRVITFGGFMEGKFSPDLAFIITEPVMKMIASIGIQGGVKKFRISMQDLTNNKAMKSILDITYMITL